MELATVLACCPALPEKPSLEEPIVRNAKAGTLFFLTLLLFIIPALSANAGELSPGLRAMLDDVPTDQPVSVLVHFTDRADIQALSQELTARKATRKRRHAEIVYSLQDAARIQDDLALELDTATDRDGILGYTRYWIANVMVVYAIPAEIERIAQRAEVDYIEPNFVPELIEPVSIESANGGRAEMDTRGIGTTPGISAIRAPEVWEQLGIDGSGSIIGSLDVNEIRPGNFVFFDLMMWTRGICNTEELAAATVCPVVALYPDKNKVVLHGGAVHLSREYLLGPENKPIFGYLGVLSLNQSNKLIPKVLSDAPVVTLSQEHGTVELTPENYQKYIQDLKIGDLVLVWPVHSCLTCDLANEYRADTKATLTKK